MRKLILLILISGFCGSLSCMRIPLGNKNIRGYSKEQIESHAITVLGYVKDGNSEGLEFHLNGLEPTIKSTLLNMRINDRKDNTKKHFLIYAYEKLEEAFHSKIIRAQIMSTLISHNSEVGNNSLMQSLPHVFKVLAQKVANNNDYDTNSIIRGVSYKDLIARNQYFRDRNLKKLSNNMRDKRREEKQKHGRHNVSNGRRLFY